MKFNKTPVDWCVNVSSPEFLSEMKEHEGTKEYQIKIGTYKGGKFVKYKDSLGFWTIGFGHLIKANENFDKGIDDPSADKLLSADLSIAANDAKKLADKYKMKLPERAQYVLTGMVFQLGVTKVQKFVKFLTALAKNDYISAANEMCNSAWYKQTPNRVKKLSDDIRSLAG